MQAMYATDGHGASIADPRRAIAVGCRVLAAAGQSDLVLGHLSARDVDGRGTWIKASGKGFEEITPDDVILIDDDGHVLEGDGRCHAEYPIHTEVLAARPDVGSVVHTHAVAPVAVSAVGVPLRPISHDGCLFATPELPWFDQTADLITDRPLGRDVAKALGTHHAMLLVNHGVVTAGRDVPESVMTALLLDRACRIQLLAAAAGDLRNFSDDAEAASKRENVYNRSTVEKMWQHLLRIHSIDP